MALDVRCVGELNASATAGNVNGILFNPFNANFPTDGTTDANTGNTSSPVFKSASYTFLASDVGHWVFIKSGSNSVPGYYQISIVSGGKATLTGTIGSANIVDTTTSYPNPRWRASTVAGIATVGTPTSLTWGIDYSRSTTARVNGLTDFNAVGGSTNLTSATAAFHPAMVGNHFHQTTTGTGGFGIVGWYEIVSYTNATTVVLDRTPNSGTASVNTTGYVGGAASMNSTLDDALWEILAGTNSTGAMRVFGLNGTYALGQSISVSVGAGGTLAPVAIEGYEVIRGDMPQGTTRPIFNGAANSFIDGVYFDYVSCQFTGTAATAKTPGTGNKFFRCKFTNSSTATGRIAVAGAGSMFMRNCEVNSYRGIGINSGANTVTLWGCYIHDSDTGISQASTGAVWNLFYSIISDNVTAAIATTVAVTGGIHVFNCTLYGAENKLGIGLSLTSGTTAVRVVNSILYGFTTAWVAGAVQSVMLSMYNNYFNNTTDMSNMTMGQGDISLNPTFTSMAQIAGTGATSTTNVLTDGTANFSTVTDNVDFVYISSGTGTGIALNKYLINSHTTTTLTVSSNITSSGNGSSIVYQITTGHDFSVGSNMSGTGWPGVLGSLPMTGYPDTGAIQRQPTTSSAPIAVGYPILS